MNSPSALPPAAVDLKSPESGGAPFTSDAVMILDDGREATLATLRPDGWPQATIVNYVNDKMRVFFDCAKSSQKAHNIALDDRVSLSLVAPYPAYGPIYGLSLAGHAQLIKDPAELSYVLGLWKTRYPFMSERLEGGLSDFAFYAVEPIAITRLHYTAGLGHRH